MEVKINFLDRAIGFFDPAAATRRVTQRAKQDLLIDSVRRFDAASHSRRTADWHTTGTSANKETEMSLHTLRYRSRELVRNNPFAKRAIQAIAINTVGLGIRPSVRKSKMNKISEAQIQKLKDAWADWGETTDCDFDGKCNMYGLQNLAARCLAESGEVLIMRRWTTDKKKSLPVQIQILEPDYIDHHRNTPQGFKDAKGGYCIQGVQFDEFGLRIGYWMYKVHPGEGMVQMSQLIPDSDVLHVFDKERAGQVRGIPSLATSAMTLRDFDQYEQAQLIRQKIAACFSAFVTDTNIDQSLPSGTKGDGMEKLEPGMVKYLAAGQTMTFANPPTVQNYDEYATAMLRKAASGIGISYEVLTGDLSNVNFSSGRMGWIEMHRYIQHLQMLVIVPQMCDPIWGWFLEACHLAGAVKEGVIKTKAKWTPPRREMIDPVKEGKALIELIRAGLISWSDGARQQGQDPETLLAEVVEDFKNMEDADLMLTCDSRFDATRTNGALPVDENAEHDDGEEQTGKQKKMLKKAGKPQ